jgi:hypothetical protein
VTLHDRLWRVPSKINRRLIHVVLATFCLGARPGEAQDTGLVFHTSSRLILVDVVALKEGLPEKTLSRDDFQLFDNGVPVTIKTYDTGSQSTSRTLSLDGRAVQDARLGLARVWLVRRTDPPFSARAEEVGTPRHSRSGFRYELGFEPAAMDGKRHKLTARLTDPAAKRHPRVRLRYRAAYVPVVEKK